MEVVPAPLLIVAIAVLLALPLALWRWSSERRRAQRRLLLAVLIALVIGVGAWVFFFQGPPEAKEIPYSGSAGSFLGLVKAGQVPRVVQQGARLRITHDLGNGKTEPLVSQVPSGLTNLRTEIVDACAEPDAVPDCASKVAISAEEPSQTGQVLTLLLTALLPVILIGAIFIFMTRQARSSTRGLMGQRRTTRDRLEELEGLRSSHAISEVEYAAKRKEILEDL